VEDVSDDLHQTLKDGKGIFIKDLRKTFQTTAGPKNAVDGLDLKMYHNQITCLLGHNGAGKTTTIGMLTGLIDATSGMASVDGKDVFTQMKEIRQDLGVCPQHDILYDRPACSTLPQPTSTHSLAPPQVPGPDRQGAPAPLLRLQGRSQQRDRGWHHQHGGAGRARGEGQRVRARVMMGLSRLGKCEFQRVPAQSLSRVPMCSFALPLAPPRPPVLSRPSPRTAAILILTYSSFCSLRSLLASPAGSPRTCPGA
jgi:hypothetical protein